MPPVVLILRSLEPAVVFGRCMPVTGNEERELELAFRYRSYLTLACKKDRHIRWVRPNEYTAWKIDFSGYI